MHTNLDRIFNKPTDYKVCKECSSFIWYEKDHCHNCSSTEFIENTKRVKQIAKSEIDYYNSNNYDGYNIEVDI